MTTSPPRPSRFSQFLAELKRRHVVRFSLGYAAAAFVVLQLAEIVFPAFQIGETGLRILVVAVALLYPPAVVLAWIFDVTGEGIERTSQGPGARSRLAPGLALLGVTVVIVGSVWVWLAAQGVLDQAEPSGRGGGGRTPEEPTLVAYNPSDPIRSLAVLPLGDFSPDGERGYFAQGMQEELIAQLSQIPGLRVVSRTTTQRYADTDLPMARIGQDLQVDAVIEGSIQRGQDTVRITLQLIHAASDTHIWTKQYDRALENLLAVQSEVALDIASQIQAELSPEETTVLQRVATRAADPEAQDAYLRGRFEASKGTPEALATAQDLFQTAVDEDSSFAPALAGLAGTRFLLGLADSVLSVEEAALVQEAAQRALALDTTSLEAKEVLSLVRRSAPPEVVPRELTRSLPRSLPASAPAQPGVPDTAWFHSLSQLGRQIEARVRSHATSGDRDPNVARFVGARGLMAAGMFPEAVEMLSDVVDDNPQMGAAWELLARAEVARGEPQAAVGVMEGWSARGGEDAPDASSVQALRSQVAQEGAAGFWRWTLNRLEARAAAGHHVAPTERAAAQAGSGNVEGALRSLQEAVAQGDRGLVTLQKEPVWDAVRGDPRFAEIARKGRTVFVDVRERGPGPR